MKENDIYHWSYTDKKMADMQKHWSSYELIYWATSRICVCKKTEGGLQLYDTYWGNSGDNKRIEPNDVELEYLGNFEELDAFSGNRAHFNPADILDLSHSNSFRKEVYIKKGAKKSLKAISEHIQKKIKEKEYEARSASRDVERYKEVLAGLNENNLDSVWI